MVAPEAKEKAAPGFRTKVNCRNSPITLMFDLYERLLTAQILVAKSRIQTAQATLKRMRHVRTASAVLPSACTACRELREEILANELYQLVNRILRNFHKSCSQCAQVRVRSAKPCRAR